MSTGIALKIVKNDRNVYDGHAFIRFQGFSNGVAVWTYENDRIARGEAADSVG
jgi:hypothetical protein